MKTVGYAVKGTAAHMPEPIQDLDFRRATANDADAIADAHRDSILALGAAYYAPAVVRKWAAVVRPELYVAAMDRSEVFFVATGTVAARPVVLGFSSDYPIDGTTHGTSAYVRSRRGAVSVRACPRWQSPSAGRAAQPQYRSKRHSVQWSSTRGTVLSRPPGGDVMFRADFTCPC